MKVTIWDRTKLRPFCDECYATETGGDVAPATHHIEMELGELNIDLCASHMVELGQKITHPTEIHQ